MNENTHPVHIGVLLDRSESMEPTADEVVGGLNAFVGKQLRVEETAYVALAQFDG